MGRLLIGLRAVGSIVAGRVLVISSRGEPQRHTLVECVEDADLFPADRPGQRVAFVSYCLQVTLKYRARAVAPGLTPRTVLEKFEEMQMVDVHLPTTDGRELILSRYTQSEKDLLLLLRQLKLDLPAQPPPRIKASMATA